MEGGREAPTLDWGGREATSRGGGWQGAGHRRKPDGTLPQAGLQLPVLFLLILLLLLLLILLLLLLLRLLLLLLLLLLHLLFLDVVLPFSL